ncbi:MAG: HDOD domain-containing protein [Gammaproteobacteria bacterium]|nr:HDOD domain-containing protein [Gammaproteobacteria bacterium]
MPETLQEWTEKLTSEAFPVLQSTIDNLNALFAEDNSSYRQIASAIMSDPGMVANTLHAANTIQGHSLHHSIQTVEHALMKMGMDQSASLHQQLPVLETILKQSSPTVRSHVMGVYERSHHAAYQAMDLLKRMGEPEPGEVYIATFLNGLGEILMWLHASQHASQIVSYCQNNEVTREEAERAILGFSYVELTHAIVSKMGFSPLLEQLLERENIDTLRCLGMLLGIRLSHLAEHGWYDAEMLKCLCDIAEFIRQPLEIAITIVHSNAAAAARHHQYGVPAAASLLPWLSNGLPPKLLHDEAERVAHIEFPTLLSHDQLEQIQLVLREQSEVDYELVIREPIDPQLVQEFMVKVPFEEGVDTELVISDKPTATAADSGNELVVAEDEDGDDTYIISYEKRDKQLEKEGICPLPDEHSLEETLQRLTKEIDQSISMPAIMKLVMQGMHDGLGLNRVAFTMLSPDRSQLKTRAVMSLDDDWDIRHLHIPLKPDNLFTHLINRPQALWLNDENATKIWSHVPAELQDTLHADGFFVMSIYVKNRPIGLFYADRYNHEHRLDEHTYENFKRLCRHATKAMVELSQ